MIEKLNFFDLYGYLLPGGFLLALLWLPFGLLLNKWPPADLGSAVLGLAAAYVAGHLLHIFSEALVSSNFQDSRGTERKPSDLLLDKNGDQQLPPMCKLEQEVKDDLQTQISSKFDGLNVSVNLSLASDDIDALSKQIREQLATQPNAQQKRNLEQQLADLEHAQGNRNAAFHKCRAFLISKKAAAYAEQMQGMQVLLRGMAAALGLASSLYLGLSTGFFISDGARCLMRAWANPPQWLFYQFIPVLIFLISFSGLILIEVRLARRCFHPMDSKLARKQAYYVYACILACAGAVASIALAISVLRTPSKLILTGYEGAICLPASIFALSLSLFCAASSRSFAALFASRVYRDFNTLVAIEKTDSSRIKALAQENS